MSPLSISDWTHLPKNLSLPNTQCSSGPLNDGDMFQEMHPYTISSLYDIRNCPDTSLDGTAYYIEAVW